MALADSEPPDLDVEAAFNLAQTLLQDLPECWNRLQPLERPQFLRALFPEGFTYHDDHVETASDSLVDQRKPAPPAPIPIWYPVRDLNPCYHLERVAS